MIHALTLILLCQLSGEALARWLGLPVPGPVLGMGLMLVLLSSSARIAALVVPVGTGILRHIALLFVPAGVGVVGHLDRLGPQAAALALEAGIDIELPKADCYAAPLRQAIESGAVRESLLDEVVRRVLAQKFVVGVFEQPYVDAGKVDFDTAQDRALARKLAQKSFVLLRNEGDLLPLKPEIGSLAVIGPNADSLRNLFGDYA